jgi:hypothetical protein
MTSAPRSCGDQFKTERFETKVDLRVHQAAGMNREEFHWFGKIIDLFDSSASYFAYRKMRNPLFSSRDVRRARTE